MEEFDNNGTVPAVDRAIYILEYLSKRKNATIKDISSDLNIPTASATRIIRTLTTHGFLSEQEGKNAASYSLGLKLLCLSQTVIQQLDILKIAYDDMEKLSDGTNQASQLAIMDKGKIIYVEMVLPISPVSIIAPLRVPVAANLSACGKVILADMDDKTLNTFLNNITLTRATEKSITNKHLFIEHLEIVRKQGFAIDDEEFSVGIGCMAAPVRDYTNKVIAAVGVTGPISRYQTNSSFEIIKKAVIKAATSISQKLGYQIS
jgi:DNA-binding IclR family transcriptional regulator